MAPSADIAHVEHERRLQRLIRRLPGKMQAITRWLRRPASRWARIPAGVFLIIGGCLSILPFLGLWMLPLGLVLLPKTSRPCAGRVDGRSTGSRAASRTGLAPPERGRRTPRRSKNRMFRRLRRQPAAIDFVLFLTHL
jgi:hypothetical protein